MFLKVKKMPKLFRFTAAEFASRDVPVEVKELFNKYYDKILFIKNYRN